MHLHKAVDKTQVMSKVIPLEEDFDIEVVAPLVSGLYANLSFSLSLYLFFFVLCTYSVSRAKLRSIGMYGGWELLIPQRC